jgi:hypothetical protein
MVPRKGCQYQNAIRLKGHRIDLELAGASLNPSGDIRYSRGVRLRDNIVYGDPRASRGDVVQDAGQF